MVGRVGYARVFTADQSVGLQVDALQQAGCHRVLTDEGVSGVRDDRPGLVGLLDYVRSGDEVVVWRRERLGRSLSHLVSVVTGLEQRGIGFCSLTAGINTGTAGEGSSFFIRSRLLRSLSGV